MKIGNILHEALCKLPTTLGIGVFVSGFTFTFCSLFYLILTNTLIYAILTIFIVYMLISCCCYGVEIYRTWKNYEKTD